MTKRRAQQGASGGTATVKRAKLDRVFLETRGDPEAEVHEGTQSGTHPGGQKCSQHAGSAHRSADVSRRELPKEPDTNKLDAAAAAAAATRSIVQQASADAATGPITPEIPPTAPLCLNMQPRQRMVSQQHNKQQHSDAVLGKQARRRAALLLVQRQGGAASAGTNPSSGGSNSSMAVQAKDTAAAVGSSSTSDAELNPTSITQDRHQSLEYVPLTLVGSRQAQEISTSVRGPWAQRRARLLMQPAGSAAAAADAGRANGTSSEQSGMQQQQQQHEPAAAEAQQVCHLAFKQQSSTAAARNDLVQENQQLLQPSQTNDAAPVAAEQQPDSAALWEAELDVGQESAQLEATAAARLADDRQPRACQASDGTSAAAAAEANGKHPVQNLPSCAPATSACSPGAAEAAAAAVPSLEMAGAPGTVSSQHTGLPDCGGQAGLVDGQLASTAVPIVAAGKSGQVATCRTNSGQVQPPVSAVPADGQAAATVTAAVVALAEADGMAEAACKECQETEGGSGAADTDHDSSPTQQQRQQLAAGTLLGHRLLPAANHGQATANQLVQRRSMRAGGRAQRRAALLGVQDSQAGSSCPWFELLQSAAADAGDSDHESDGNHRHGMVQPPQPLPPQQQKQQEPGQAAVGRKRLADMTAKSLKARRMAQLLMLPTDGQAAQPDIVDAAPGTTAACSSNPTKQHPEQQQQSQQQQLEPDAVADESVLESQTTAAAAAAAGVVEHMDTGPAVAAVSPSSQPCANVAQYNSLQLQPPAAAGGAPCSDATAVARSPSPADFMPNFNTLGQVAALVSSLVPGASAASSLNDTSSEPGESDLDDDGSSSKPESSGDGSTSGDTTSSDGRGRDSSGNGSDGTSSDATSRGARSNSATSSDATDPAPSEKETSNSKDRSQHEYDSSDRMDAHFQAATCCEASIDAVMDDMGDTGGLAAHAAGAAAAAEAGPPVQATSGDSVDTTSSANTSSDSGSEPNSNRDLEVGGDTAVAAAHAGHLGMLPVLSHTAAESPVQPAHEPSRAARDASSDSSSHSSGISDEPDTSSSLVISSSEPGSSGGGAAGPDDNDMNASDGERATAAAAGHQVMPAEDGPDDIGSTWQSSLSSGSSGAPSSPDVEGAEDEHDADDQATSPNAGWGVDTVDLTTPPALIAPEIHTCNGGNQHPSNSNGYGDISSGDSPQPSSSINHSSSSTSDPSGPGNGGDTAECDSGLVMQTAVEDSDAAAPGSECADGLQQTAEPLPNQQQQQTLQPPGSNMCKLPRAESPEAVAFLLGAATVEVAQQQLTKQQAGQQAGVEHQEQQQYATPVLTEQQRVRSCHTSPITPEQQQPAVSELLAASGVGSSQPLPATVAESPYKSAAGWVGVAPAPVQSIMPAMGQLQSSMCIPAAGDKQQQQQHTEGLPDFLLLTPSCKSTRSSLDASHAGGVLGEECGHDDLALEHTQPAGAMSDTGKQQDQSAPASSQPGPLTPDSAPPASRSSLTQQRQAAAAPRSQWNPQRPALGSLAQRRAALLMSPPPPTAAQGRSSSNGSNSSKLDAWLQFQTSAALGSAGLSAAERPRDQAGHLDTNAGPGCDQGADDDGMCLKPTSSRKTKRAATPPPSLPLSDADRGSFVSADEFFELMRLNRRQDKTAHRCQGSAAASSRDTVVDILRCRPRSAPCSCSPESPGAKDYAVAGAAAAAESPGAAALQPNLDDPAAATPNKTKQIAGQAQGDAAYDLGSTPMSSRCTPTRQIAPAALVGVSRTMVYVRTPGSKQGRFAQGMKGIRRGAELGLSVSLSAGGDLPDGAGTCPVKETLEQSVRAAHLDLNLALAAAEGAAWARCDLAGLPLNHSDAQLKAYRDSYQAARGRLVRCRHPADVAKLDKLVAQEWEWLKDVRQRAATAASQCSKQGVLKVVASKSAASVRPGGWLVNTSGAGPAEAHTAAAANRVRFSMPA